jgi:DNA-binding response OmpR family regulator
VNDGAKKKILIVEDEPDIRELVRYNLEHAGFRVIEADDGETALHKVRSEQPALVILDLMLPEGDGLEVCRILRGERETAALPIVMLTAKAAEVDRVLGLEFGADDYVTKTFRPVRWWRAYGGPAPLRYRRAGAADGALRPRPSAHQLRQP